MNRQIKFRAWHKALKKMFSAEEMGKDELTLAVDGRGFVNVSSVSPRLSGYAGDSMIPLQFTGLKDKNGKEIYEGDIIHHGQEETSGEKNEVIFASGMWKLKVKNYAFGEGYELRHVLYDTDFFEIIGNIYDNPE